MLLLVPFEAEVSRIHMNHTIDHVRDFGSIGKSCTVDHCISGASQ